MASARQVWHITWLFGLLACGCAVVRVEPGSGPSMVASMRASVPGDDNLSARTLQELYRLDLYRLYPEHIDEIAERLHQETVNEARPDLLFALAEVSHFRGRVFELRQNARATTCYFRAAGYAWHYLFGENGIVGDNAAMFDPRFRLACDVYNTSLARCVILALTWGQMDATGRLQLPALEDHCQPAQLTVSHLGFAIQPEEIGSLTPCSAHRIVGLGSMQRTYGIGVPLVGQRNPNVSRPFVPPEMTFPISAVCRFEGKLTELIGQPRAKLELINPNSTLTLRIGERDVPLESDLTTPLACYLGQSHFEKAGYLSFLKPNIVGDRGGLHFLEPYTPGKIPIIFVHGLLSSPQTWTPPINELLADPVIRKRCNFGVFFYPTGEPYLATAADLRRDLTHYRAAVDPEGKDPALQQVMLVGHSMGGLVSRLLTVDGGEDFWQAASSAPFDKLQESRGREKLQRMYLFARDHGVTRVLFCAAPHHGSQLSRSKVGWVGTKLAGLPHDLVHTKAEILKLNTHLERFECRLHNSVELLSPDAPALRILGTRPRPAEVKYHSVIGVMMTHSSLAESCFGKNPIGDGVVPLSSAQRNDTSSEIVVQADHTTVHLHPLAMRELKRVVREHIDALPKKE